MSDYIPYEVRRENERRKLEDGQAKQRAVRAGKVAEVQQALSDLAGDGTDFYIEVLRPARLLDRFVTSKPRVVCHGRVGGPNFIIDEVIAVYRLPNAIHVPIRGESKHHVFDAYVTPDGLLWLFAGATDDENVLQHLASSVERIADLSTDNLDRVVEGLRSVHERVDARKDKR